MSCLFCSDGKLRPEFWLGAYTENSYYVTVISGTMLDERNFHTAIYPPDLVAQWIRDGGICFRNRFLLWSDVKEVTWSPTLSAVPLEKTDE